MNQNCKQDVLMNFKMPKVSNLLISEGEWDVELIRDIVTNNDVDRILSTPISPLHSDSWCWKGDVRGLYTVKHGYHLLTTNLMHQAQATSFVEWRCLWNLSVLPKVKIFIWRCLHYILLVYEVLISKRVCAGGGCALCTAQMETIVGKIA